MNISMSSCNGVTKVIINGKETIIRGENVSICGSRIFVDGQEYSDVDGLYKDSNVISITIEGNVNSIDCNGDVTVRGNVDSIRADGNVNIDGSVEGNVNAGGNCNIAGNHTGRINAGGNVFTGSRKF